jgi:hypothetical protein
MLLVASFLTVGVQHARAVTCNPPLVLTGCTMEGSGGLDITATVPVPPVLAPTVTTDPATSVTETTAVVNGTITDTGGADATVKGFNYGTSIAYDTTSLNSGAFGVGAFSATLTGLVCGTTYHFQAYATNSSGTGLGSDASFVTSDCPVVPTPVPSPTSGGNRGGTTYTQTSSTVNFSGTAYPGAHVVILKDGNVMVAVTAASDASFVASVTGVAEGSYVFSVYATDAKGRQSAAYSFPFYINGRSVVNIGGILLAPTASLDRPQTVAGGTITVSGASAPLAVITLTLGSRTQKYSTLTDTAGNYTFGIATAGFADGSYTVRARALIGGKESPFGKMLSFFVGLSIPEKPEVCGVALGDINCDGRVNIVDYSIMKYWYKKPNPPANVDLSGDGKITLKDFSILTSNWTG